ncbi:chromate transporter [Limihaloglobus sulfuriphilus]|nr:chromate transporter [Limihaloglobus sulfuriphilus]
MIFFKVGLFAVGGGVAAIPLMQESVVETGMIRQQDFIDMIAVSQSTPGPIGINIATYVGYRAGGVGGSLAATVGMAAPSVIIILLIAGFVKDFNSHTSIRRVMYALRPTALGLIATAAWFIFNVSVVSFNSMDSPGWFDWRRLLIFAVLAVWYYFKKTHPIIFIGAGAVLGVILL